MKVTIMNHYINKEKKGFSAFVNKCIGFFTRSNAWHTSIILGDMRYESGHPRGASKTRTIPKHSHVDTFSFDVAQEQFEAMVAHAEKTLTDNLRYNYHKLFVLALCWPTRWIWNKLKWVPFSHNYFGEVCSVYVREILLAGDIDFFPKVYKELTPPKLFAEYMGE